MNELKKTNQIDLHVHTTASDGTLTPSEVVRLAKKTGLAAIAITDHDSTDGTEEAVRTGEEIGMEVIPGIELSTEYHDVEIHMVGLFVDSECRTLQNQCRSFREKRDGRNEKMIHLLQEEGFSITAEEVYRRNPHSVVARPHIARYLVDTGQAPDVKWVFDNYIANDRKCFVGREMITPFDAVSLIHQADGTAILAHPCLYKKLSDSALYQMIGELAAAGLDGIEVRYSRNREGDEERFRAQAEKYHLLLSGGSDFHGANKPDISLGSGTGNLSVPYEFLQAVKDFRTQERK